MMKSLSFKKPGYNWKKKIISVFVLILIIFNTACGNNNKKEEPPVLLEPVESEVLYRIAEKKDIMDTEVVTGYVDCKKYTCAYLESTTVEKILVNIGDEVKKGQVVAQGDVENLEKSKNALIQEKNYETAVFEKEIAILDIDIEMKKIELEDANSAGKTSLADSINIEISKLNLDRSYKEDIYNIRNKDKESKINKINQDISKQTLLAQSDGVVTWIKSLVNKNASAKEAVVIIQNENEKLVISNSKILDTKEGDEVFAICNGKEYKVKENIYNRVLLGKMGVEYTNEFIIEGDQDIEPGSNVLIKTNRNITKDVVAIYNDSLYKEGDNFYVYKLNGESREKIKIEVGNRTSLETQVISGIEPGDKITYEFSESFIGKYKEVVIKKGDYSEEKSILSSNYYSTIVPQKISDYQGKIELRAVYKKQNEDVEIGEPICKIRLEDKSAEILEAETLKTRMINNYNLSTEETNKVITSMNQEIATMKADITANQIEIRKFENRLRKTIVEKELSDISHNYTLKSQNEIIQNYRANSGTKDVKSITNGKVLQNDFNSTTYDLDNPDSMPSDNVLMPSEDSFEMFVVEKNYSVLEFEGAVNNCQKIVVKSKTGEYSYDTRVYNMKTKNKYFEGVDGNVEIYTRTEPEVFGVVKTSKYIYLGNLSEKDKFDIDNTEIVVSMNKYNGIIAINKKDVYTLKEDKNQHYVWVVNSDKIKELRYVEVDKEIVDDKYVINCGLKEGDIICSIVEEEEK